MMTRGQIARETGCNSETIRYYETIGLLPKPARSPSGYRIYDDRHLRTLRFIGRAKSLGFSTDQVRDLLALSEEHGDHTRAEVKALTQDHIEDIAHRIDDLEKLKNRLLQIASHCDGSDQSAESCPILISLFSGDNDESAAE